MVAYSFKPRFVAPIQAGTKCQTIRGERARDAKPGERLQLFTGMRTQFCEKIIPDPVCLDVSPVFMQWGSRNFTKICVIPSKAFDGVYNPDYDVDFDDYDAFARADGFGNAAEMLAFWQGEHGDFEDTFKGVLIRWQGDAP